MLQKYEILLYYYFGPWRVWCRAGTGSRVTGSPGQWLCPGRVGSRVKVIYLQTRNRDPVADRTTEWYSMVNTWTHCAKSRLNEHAASVEPDANCLTVGSLLQVLTFISLPWRQSYRNAAAAPDDAHRCSKRCILPRVAMLARCASSCVCVCVSVRHLPVLYQTAKFRMHAERLPCTVACVYQVWSWQLKLFSF